MKRIDKTTKDHFNKYAQIAKKYGMSFTKSSYMKERKKWQDLYDLDRHLNNVPLSFWDPLYNYNLTALSIAERCCLYKHLMIYDVIGAIPEFKQ